MATGRDKRVGCPFSLLFSLAHPFLLHRTREVLTRMHQFECVPSMSK